MEWLTILCIWVVIGLIIGLLAVRKHRNGWGWGIIGGLSCIGGYFCVIPFIVLCFVNFLCPECKSPMTNQEWKQKKCPRCGWQSIASCTNKQEEMLSNKCS